MTFYTESRGMDLPLASNVTTSQNSVPRLSELCYREIMRVVGSSLIHEVECEYNPLWFYLFGVIAGVNDRWEILTFL